MEPNKCFERRGGNSSARSEPTSKPIPGSLGHDGTHHEGLAPGVNVDVKRLAANSGVGLSPFCTFGCKTGFALYQIDKHTWEWQLIENRESAESTTLLGQNGLRPASYVSVIQPCCQAELGFVSRNARQLSASPLARLQVPHR